MLGKGVIWVLRDEILRSAQNDKVEALGTVVGTIRKGWLILRCAQNDEDEAEGK